MSRRTIWSTLGIARTTDEREIRRAYAGKLKSTHPEDDPEGFKALRVDYEKALQQARWGDVDEWEIDDEAAPEGGLQPPAGPDGPDNDEKPVELSPFVLAQQRLFNALDGSAPVDEMLAALHEVLHSPDTVQVDVSRAIERMLAHLIVDYAPRSDPIAEAISDHFGWRTVAKTFRRDPYIEHALKRLEDLRAMRSAIANDGGHRAAFKALAAPLDTRRFERQIIFSPIGRHVETVLMILDRDRPSLFANLNGETVAWWRARLQRPCFPGRIWLWTAPSMAVSALVWFLATVEKNFLLAPVVAIAGALGAFALAGGPFLLQTYVIDVVFGRNIRERVEELPVWIRTLWGPGCLLLLLAAAVLPASPWTMAGLAVPAGLLAFWAFVAAPPAVKTGAMARWLAMIWFHLALVLWWCFMAVSLPRWPQVLAVLAATVISFSRGSDLLDQIWFDLKSKARVRFAGASLIACAAVGAGIFAAQDNTFAMTVLAAAVSALCLTSVLTAPYLGGVGRQIRHYSLWLITVAVMAGAELEQRFLVGGLMLLASVAIPAAMVLLRELRPAKRKASPWA